MLTLNQSLYCAAIKHLEEEFMVDPSQVETKFDDRPQHNEDGSVTHSLVLTIKNIKYDVEVYAHNGDYTAECWRVNGELNMSFVIHK